MAYGLHCNHWSPEGERCTEEAEGWLINDDGERNPGGFVCREHAELVIEEYKSKLGLSWSFEEADF